MIQQCPECGLWCEVEKQGLLGKASRGFDSAAEGGGRIGASIGRSLFGKTGEKYGAIFGGGAVGGSGLGFLNAASESLLAQITILFVRIVVMNGKLTTLTMTRQKNIMHG